MEQHPSPEESTVRTKRPGFETAKAVACDVARFPRRQTRWMLENEVDNGLKDPLHPSVSDCKSVKVLGEEDD